MNTAPTICHPNSLSMSPTGGRKGRDTNQTRFARSNEQAITRN